MSRPPPALAGEDLVSLNELQDALLPSDLPVLPRLEVAARFLPAESGDTGGDWFDAIPLAHDKVALVVGAAGGRGLSAAVVMGKLQAVLRERLESGADIAHAVQCLDRYATGQPDADGSTVCVVSVDVRTGAVEYVTAGHPPPLVTSRRGAFRYFAPLGLGPLANGTVFASNSEQLTPDELMVIYTTGVVTRPGRSAAENSLDLARAATKAFGEKSPHRRHTVDGDCGRILELLAQPAGYTDDVTMLAVARVPTPRTLAVTLPARPTSVRAARDDVGSWLDHLGTRALDRIAVLQAVTEVVGNAVEHAYVSAARSAENEVRVDATLTSQGLAQVTVVDHGRWRDDPTRPHGYGLARAGGFVDELKIDHREDGTTVQIRHRLGRPAHILELTSPAGRPTDPRRADTDPGQTIDVSSGRLVAQGSLGGDGTDELRAGLLVATRAGSVDATVDLGRVTQLSRAAVRALFEAVRRNGEHRTRLTVIAPPGTPAQHVLELVALPYQADSSDPRGESTRR